MSSSHSKALSRATVSLVLAALAACVLILINELGYGRSRAELDSMAHEFHTRNELSRLLQLVLDAETGSRGFLLTGDARYLEPYDRAVSEIGQSLAALREARAGDGADARTVAELETHVQRKLSEMQLSVGMRKQGREDAWKFVLLTDVGKEHMDAIRADAAQLIRSAAQRIEASQAQVHRSLLLARLGIAAAALAALLAFWLYQRQSSALRAADERQQAALQQERDQLEQQVRDRTATLADLATHLQQVREEERGHLARELHDELGALLTAAKLDVARLKSRVAANPDVLQRLQHLTETLNKGIALKRRIIEDLRPSSLSNLGLVPSLEILAREFTDQTGVQVATQLEPVDLDETHQLTVYRLVQESLTNMAKYAQASRAEVLVRATDREVEVRVSDDGRGFDPARARATTHGLAGMRHRVEAAGGRLAIDSAPGRGTRILALLPRQLPGR